MAVFSGVVVWGDPGDRGPFWHGTSWRDTVHVRFLVERKMWPRIFELGLGLWLLVSPRVIVYPADSIPWSVGTGTFVIMASLLAWSRLGDLARVGTLFAGIGLTGIAYVGAPYPAPAFLQNEFLVGILLARVY